MQVGLRADWRRTRLRERQAFGAGLRLRRTQGLGDAGRVVQVADFVDDALDLREPENSKQCAELPSAGGKHCGSRGEHHGISLTYGRCPGEVRRERGLFIFSVGTSVDRYSPCNRPIVSGNRCKSRISNAAWALGLARPCSQFSSVRALVRR